MEFNAHQRQVFLSLVKDLNNQHIKYTILRGFEDLPFSFSGGDVDMLVNQECFNDMIRICNLHGFDKKLNFINGFKNLAKLGIEMPYLTVKRLLSNPLESISAVKDILKDGNSYESLSANFQSLVLHNSGIKLHVVNHLAYTSPMNGNLIRINPKVEKRSLESSIINKNYFFKHLSEPDELLHLTCRGVFDYGGSFPDYYVDRIHELNSSMTNAECESLKSNLDLVFYAASDLVYESICSNSIENLHTNLIQFSNY